MEERTKIGLVKISKLLDSLENCKCYDDAKKMLNGLVTDNIGKQYAEDDKAYKNSSSFEDVKAEIIRSCYEMLNSITAINNVSHHVFELYRDAKKNVGKIIDDSVIFQFNEEFKARNEKVRRFIEIWEKDNSITKIKVELDKQPKVREEKRSEAIEIFNGLIRNGYLDKSTTVDDWLCLCGLSKKEHISKIRWIKKRRKKDLGTLFNCFFMNDYYFEKKYIQENLANYFIDENGNTFKYDNIKNNKDNSIKSETHPKFKEMIRE